MKSFRNLRMNNRFHLGLGDVRLTIAMQDEIEEKIISLEEEKESRVYYQSIVYDVCNIIRDVTGKDPFVGNSNDPSTDVQDKLRELLTNTKVA